MCPRDLIGRIAGDGGFLSILGATLVGIPSYLNGNAALPLVAGLIDKGMAPGAAMAFLVGGGVTSIPAALAVWGIARRQVFAAYLAFAILGALLSGVAFQIVAGSILCNLSTPVTADWLNGSCFCITLDRQRLYAALERQVGDPRILHPLPSASRASLFQRARVPRRARSGENDRRRPHDRGGIAPAWSIARRL